MKARNKYGIMAAVIGFILVIGYLIWANFKSKFPFGTTTASTGLGGTSTGPAPNPTSNARGLRNNNPGNIVISANAWQGKISPNTDGKFEQFDTMTHGARALKKNLKSYIAKGFDTIAEIIPRWSGESNPTNYIAFVERETGWDRGRTLTENEVTALALPIAKFENGPANVTEEIADEITNAPAV